LRPNRATVDELVARLGPHLSRSAEGLVFRTDAQGRVHVDLAERAQHVMMSTPAPGGGVRYTCADDVAEVERLLRQAPLPPLGAPATPSATPTVVPADPEGALGPTR
jgi:hypothetical protein